MTREEAIYKANHLRKVHPSICIDAEDFWKTVIAALEQEPCEDAISRKDLGLTNFEIFMCDGNYKEALMMLLNKIEKASPVTPQPKTGHWIETDMYDESVYKCSCCGESYCMVYGSPEEYGYIYCPCCGAKME